MKVASERELALGILSNVERRNSFSNLEINKALSREGSMADTLNQGFLRELVYGVLERKLYLDYRLDGLVKRGVKSLKPDILNILRIGAYQLEFMDGVPNYAAIDTSVNLAKKKSGGLSGLVNGVLRSYDREKVKELSEETLGERRFLQLKHSVGEEMLDLLLEQYGREESEKFLSSSLGNKPLELRANLVRKDRESLMREMEEEGFSVKASESTGTGILSQGGSITETRWYREGLVSIQSIGSQFIAEMAGAGEGDFIIDTCAAPGGKSLALAEAMNNRGRILSMDVSEGRLKNIKNEAKRLKSDIISADVWDGRIPKEEYREAADIVLSDVPCSGLGVISSKPEIKYRSFRAELPSLMALQREILQASSAYVKPGGRLVYSTCTVNRRENEGQVETFLDENGEFRLIEEMQLMNSYEGKDGFFVSVMERNPK